LRALPCHTLNVIANIITYQRWVAGVK
jgi:hypothetical protein